MTEILVVAAEKRTPADQMGPIAKALASQQTVRSSETSTPTVKFRPGTGFVDKVYRGKDGTESKYTVFVPPDYDGSTSVPAMLFLHGAGPRGTDGKAHLEYGLAKVIREKGDFPFLVVFPQAREGEEWKADSPGGRRALDILGAVQKHYQIDPDRVSLSGVSMGGAGTWSLAAADPKRWSAIVPLCHGGDTSSAAKLVGIPCWCFHGSADRTIRPAQSRVMIEAISKAGGKPLYQELPGVGHNDLADRVYSMKDLVEWVLLQNRTKR